MNMPDEKVSIKKSTGKLNLTTPGEGTYLEVIRRLVVELAQKVGFPDDEVAMIELAVGEACSNVVEHAYAPGKEWRWQHRDPEIRLEIRREDHQLVIEIYDHGARFDFTKYKPKDIGSLIRDGKTRGFGIPIMRQLMDEVIFSTSEEKGNSLRLVKHLKNP